VEIVNNGELDAMRLTSEVKITNTGTAIGGGTVFISARILCLFCL
jgi:hypothetical protein